MESEVTRARQKTSLTPDTLMQMTNLTFALPNGARVTLVQMVLEPTYAGALEGTRESVSAYILEKTTNAPGRQVVRPVDTAAPLPDWQCTLSFCDRDWSELEVMFWPLAVSPATSVEQLVHEVLPLLHWQDFARPYDS